MLHTSYYMFAPTHPQPPHSARLRALPRAARLRPLAPARARRAPSRETSPDVFVYDPARYEYEL